VVTNEIPSWLLGVVPLAVGGEQLRRWGLSEVWRVRVGSPEPRSVIVKRGTGEMADEARRYRELVIPLWVAAPDLLAATGGDDGEPMVLVLADVGPQTLEQRPTAEGYREAVRALARMRSVAAGRLARDPAIGADLRRTTADFVADAERVGLGDSVRALVDRLDRLAGVPATIVHGDYHAKNLIHTAEGGVVPVDWPSACIHPHLGDLYCLIREAGNLGLPTGDLPGLYAREAGTDPGEVADQMVTGGMCWTLTALRWLTDEGVEAIPEAHEWLDALAADVRTLALA
jgi:aminoglycoside phosphotransferase (APT) family kinase protein